MMREVGEEVPRYADETGPRWAFLIFISCAKAPAETPREGEEEDVAGRVVVRAGRISRWARQGLLPFFVISLRKFSETASERVRRVSLVQVSWRRVMEGERSERSSVCSSSLTIWTCLGVTP